MRNKTAQKWLNPLKVFNRMKYGWSKWGGGNHGLIKTKVGYTSDWFCQCCGAHQPEIMPQYFLEVFPREFVRICGICKHIQEQEKLQFEALKEKVLVLYVKELRLYEKK